MPTCPVGAGICRAADHAATAYLPLNHLQRSGQLAAAGDAAAGAAAAAGWAAAAREAAAAGARVAAAAEGVEREVGAGAAASRVTSARSDRQVLPAGGQF